MRTREFYPFLNPCYTMVRPSNAGNDRQSKKIRQSPDTPLYIYKYLQKYQSGFPPGCSPYGFENQLLTVFNPVSNHNSVRCNQSLLQSFYKSLSPVYSI
jgi:hypothetical protein